MTGSKVTRPPRRRHQRHANFARLRLNGSADVYRSDGFVKGLEREATRLASTGEEFSPVAPFPTGNAFVHPSGGSGVWPVLPGDPITMECTGTFPSGNGSDFNADDTYYGRIVSEASDHQLRLYPTAQDAIDETNLIQFGFAGTGTLSFFTADVVQEVETIFDALTELGWLRLQGIDDPGDLPS